jgi:hypothetical protein
VVTAIATYLFWIEYLPPFARFHLHSDIEGYHWPLLVAAFEAVRHGRIPLWDSSIYCGIPFAGNVQVAFFYPPTWILFLANLASRHLLFKSLEAWVFLHGGLALFLAYLWLRGRRLCRLSSALGACVFAFGGYMVSQNSHVGIVTGYAWTPLAWLGVDQIVETHRWRPLWKIIAALSLCLLAGYPATFVACAAGTITYAFGRSLRSGIASVGAIVLSFAVSAIELIPAAQAAAYKTFDPKYGAGVRDPLFYVHFLVPDWLGFRFGDPHMYLYLGVPALFGIPWLFKRPDRAVLSVLLTSALFLADPFGLIMTAVYRSSLLVQVLSNYSFVEPATLAFAFVAANGVDAYLHPSKAPCLRATVPKWIIFTFSGLLIALLAYRLLVWPQPVTGWGSVAGTVAVLAFFVAGLSLVRRGCAQIAILVWIAIFVDYKVNGTGHAFSSVSGDLDPAYPRGRFPGVGSEAFDIMREHREYRVAVDDVHATDLRRYGLASPQGFDPLLSSQYRSFIQQFQPFHTNRLFDIPPDNADLLQRLGVRYFLTRDGASFQAEIAKNPNFHQIGDPTSFIKVYEYAEAKPAFRLDGPGDVFKRQWLPEVREFFVNAKAARRFILLEQFYPGWQASVDARSVQIDRCEKVFQSIAVPAGSHVVRFEYRPATLFVGVGVSFGTLAVMGLVLWRDRRKQPPAGKPWSVRQG